LLSSAFVLFWVFVRPVLVVRRRRRGCSRRRRRRRRCFLLGVSRFLLLRSLHELQALQFRAKLAVAPTRCCCRCRCCSRHGDQSCKRVLRCARNIYYYNEKNRAVMNSKKQNTSKKKQILSIYSYFCARSSNTRCVVKVIHIHARTHNPFDLF